MRRVCLHYTLDRRRRGRTGMSRLLPVGRYSRNQRPLTGLKRGRVSATRLFRIVQSQARRAELQRRDAKQITDVRDAARQHTLAAVE